MSLPTVDLSPESRDLDDGDFADFLPESPHASYQLQNIIGRGSEGVVWSAIQVALDRIVAVKTVSPDKKLDDAKFPERVRYREKRFYHEALITARLDHPNIVPIHDISRVEDGSPLISMKLVKGEPWGRILAKDFSTQSTDAFLQKHLPIFISMMQAVAFAHSKGVVHRDLKPAQLVVGEFGEVVLVDWGIAVLIKDVELEYRKNIGLQPPLINLPTVGTAPNPAGTPALMAPEQTYSDA
ncbi:MAG: serine/threonine protein kinase, partial [Candidatus Sumerlaeia bacterium]|nr:serine/threonine protein kinase [Candidatus Sumerlaeia bacterium]